MVALVESGTTQATPETFLLRENIIPKLIYGLNNVSMTAKTLREADRLIKRCVKSFLHMNAHTADQSIHVKIRDGGLGIMELRSNIPRMLKSRLNKLESSKDLTILAVIKTNTH